MRGICISFNPTNVGTVRPAPANPTPPVNAVPKGDTAFCYFFRPVFPHLRDLYWFATRYVSTPFVRLTWEKGGGDDRLATALVDAGLNRHGDVLHRPGTLPELAPYLDDDWIDLVGLRGSEEEAIEVSRLLSTAGDDDLNRAAELAEIVFLCMDGFCWEFYPRDPSLLDAVTRPLEGVAGVSIRPCDLRNRAALFDDATP